MADEALKLKNAQSACVSVGIDPITSFTEGSAASIVLDNMYEPIVESEISMYPWRFATEYFDLTPNRLATVPLAEFDNAYQFPTTADVLSVDGVFINDQAIVYEQLQDTILILGSENESPILKYRTRVSETIWKPYFKLLIIMRLATLLASAVAKKDDLFKQMNDVAELHMRRAKYQDAQGQKNKRFKLNLFRKARNGSIEKFWRQ